MLLKSGYLGLTTSLSAKWFKSSSLRLDGVLPSLLAQYNENRYALNGKEKSFDALFTFSRSTIGTVQDFEGLIQTCAVDEARFEGLRRVENLLASPNDFTDSSWYKNGITGGVVPTVTANTITFVPAASDSWQNYGSVTFTHFTTGYLGRKSRLSFDMWGIAGETIAISIQFEGGDSQSYDITLTGEKTRYSLPVQTQNTASPDWGSVFIDRKLANTVTTVHIENILLEDVTGQNNQNPSNFIDSVEYFPYENGNTVSNNIVIQAHGAQIQPSIRKGLLMEGQATNQEINNTGGANTGSIATITITTPSTLRPDGIIDTVHRVIQDAGSSSGWFTSGNTVLLASAGDPFSFEIDVRPFGDLTKLKGVRFGYRFNGWTDICRISIDFETENITDVSGGGGTIGSVSIEPLVNGWYRIRAENCVSGGGYLSGLVEDNFIGSITADGTSGIDFIFKQVELSANLGSGLINIIFSSNKTSQ